ncbi:hypothetical protein GCM10010441_59460 [Kitasatospora paracochleata]
MQHPSYDPSSQPTQPGFTSASPHPPTVGQGFHQVPGRPSGPSSGESSGQASGDSAAESSGKRSHVKIWGAVAAVVSAAAGVASAVAAFMGGGGSPPTSAPAPQVTVTVGTQGSPNAGGVAAPSAQGTAAAPGSGAKVRWSGAFRLGMEGVDLTADPPAAGNGTYLRPGAARSGSSGMMVRGTVAPWSGPGEPTAEGCRQLLLTQKRNELDVSVGDQVCVVEGSSPIGVLKVTAAHYDAGSYGELDTTLTVWDLRMGR